MPTNPATPAAPGLLRSALLAVLLLLFALLGVAPHDRETWALENSLFVASLVLLVASWRRLPLSRASCVQIFLFLALHEVGAHYTYSNVPYERWWEALSGGDVGGSRNHYDRFVHLCFGLLLAYPLRELLLRLLDLRGFAGYLLPVLLTLSFSAFYELVEWAAALAFGGETAAAYVGTQGDEWDAQKDMVLALAGAVVAMAATSALRRGRKSHAGARRAG